MDRTLVSEFARTAARYAHEPALALAGGTVSYADLVTDVETAADQMRRWGVRRGDRVGIACPSATAELYVAILATMWVGAAYVPVDIDDTDERKQLVFSEAAVRGVIGAGFSWDEGPGPQTPHLDQDAELPDPDDDAWIIFTSGTTGKPKGVAITHRSAVAFLDAERKLFCQAQPLGPGDRILAGLSVAFDASIEEMWLAWANGACLVPAPRSLVKAGAELGPWLRQQRITAVSTVPSLASLWDPADLADVRLLIVGGEACSEELVTTYGGGREMWNTYGPTEATVVATAGRLTPGEPVTIGGPLEGWQIAVLDSAGEPVPDGQDGELVIAGAGLGRYLDPAKDAQKFRAVPALGWERAYFTGDVVAAKDAGLMYRGRVDDQVKINGRRIELGEIDAALTSLPGVANAAAAVQKTTAGGPVLVGYLMAAPDVTIDLVEAARLLQSRLPVGITPVLGVLPSLPLSTAGKVDRKKLPWPLPEDAGDPASSLTPTQQQIAELWSEFTGMPIGSIKPATSFFAIGGTSLATARLAARLRETWPTAGVTDVYECPTLEALAERLERAQTATAAVSAPGAAALPVRDARGAQFSVVAAFVLGFAALGGVGVWAANRAAAALTGGPWPTSLFWVVFVLGLPGVRDLWAAGLVRLIVAGVKPGHYRRGGAVHLRVRAAERLLVMARLTGLGGTARNVWLARLLGNTVGRNVVLESAPPVLGTLTAGEGANIGSGVDLAGHDISGTEFVVAPVVVGAGAAVQARATLLPGTQLPSRSTVHAATVVRPGEEGSLPKRLSVPVPHTPWWWEAIYDLGPTVAAVLRLVAAAPSVWAVYDIVAGGASWGRAVGDALLGAFLSFIAYAVVLAAEVRLFSLAVRPGVWRRGSLPAWCAWMVMARTTEARTTLYPVYASMLTPLWFRILGARVGRNVEISTASGLPTMVTLADGSFLADDVLIAAPQWADGRMTVGTAHVGARSFVGNSAVVPGGSSIGDECLIGVLSTAPPVVADGEAWMGRPARSIPRTPDSADLSRTYAPTRRLKLARAGFETLRLVPVVGNSAAALGLGAGAWVVCRQDGGWGAVLTLVVGYLAGALLAGAVAIAAKWALVGRIAAAEHPLWSSFVWRSELADCFLECWAVPWLVTHLHGTAGMNLWHRANGARLGKGVWCETHWLPEHDLVTIGDGATIGRGTVVQTHLFQDRVMRVQAVHIGSGASLGSHSVVLPESVVGDGTWVEAGSLVMRGDELPSETLWQGNPVRPVLAA